MSENEKEEVDFVDPNSGLASQPGGVVAGGVPVASEQQNSEESEQEPDGGVPGSDGEGDDGGEDGDDEEPTDPENPEEPEGGEPEGDADLESDDFEGAPEGEESEEGEDVEGDDSYAELLSGDVNSVRQYMEENPDEKDAIIAAEMERDRPRKGIVDA